MSFVNWEVQPKEFSTAFQKEYGILPAKSADRNYDAVYVLAEAIAKSGKQEAATYIASHDFKTVNGNIHFTPEHTIENLPIELDVIRGGKIEKYTGQ